MKLQKLEKIDSWGTEIQTGRDFNWGRDAWFMYNMVIRVTVQLWLRPPQRNQRPKRKLMALLEGTGKPTEWAANNLEYLTKRLIERFPALGEVFCLCSPISSSKLTVSGCFHLHWDEMLCRQLCVTLTKNANKYTGYTIWLTWWLIWCGRWILIFTWRYHDCIVPIDTYFPKKLDAFFPEYGLIACTVPALNSLGHQPIEERVGLCTRSVHHHTSNAVHVIPSWSSAECWKFTILDLCQTHAGQRHQCRKQLGSF